METTNIAIEDFLEVLYGGEKGYVYTPLKTATSFQKIWYQWPDEKTSLIDSIKTRKEQGDVYLAPVLFNSPDTQDFKLSNVVWCDFDDGTPRTLGDFPKPVFQVHSSNSPRKQHWYWRVSSQIRSADTLEGYNRSLAYMLGADRGCWNFGRILRPIDTLNHKYNPPAPVSLAAYHPDSVIDDYVFSALPEIPRPKDEEFEFTRYNIRELNKKYNWSPQAWDFFTSPKFDGERHTALCSVAITCFEMGMTRDEVMSYLLDADERWKKYVGRDDRIRRLQGICLYGEANSVQHTKTTTPVGGEKGFERFETPRTFSEFVRHEFQVDWVIEGLLHQQGLAIVASPPAVGKTQFSLNLAIALATGKDFLGWKVTRPRKILFLSLEMTQPELKYYLDKMTSELTEEEKHLLDQNLYFVARQAFRLNSEQNQRILLEWLDAIKPDGLFIDSLSRASGGDLEKTEVDNVFDYLNKEVRSHRNAFLWFVHHNRKANFAQRQPKRLEDLYGSQYIGAYASTVVGLWKITSTEIEVNCLKLWLNKPFNSFLIRRTPNLTFQAERTILEGT